MCQLEFNLERELPLHVSAIEQLHRDAFGPGRFARTAFRVREAVDPEPSLSFVATSHGHLAGSVRLSPIRIGSCKSLLLGPLAVHPDFKNKGAGKLLMERAIADAKEMDYRAILLVGDYDYYARFGFERVPMGMIVMPGPVDPLRLLLLPFDKDAACQCTGVVKPGL
ncbi:N-acetyltransferase [uncultured Cohaesibacter sp.]|uniref:GNAT family N-acetyltransferase n=1 Tax=uncultured Cohaesibacter sp. TaxID=1002546 RepID=UPI0029C62F55|nr:N-acetyltransferase [uncultured Cohaesibacter sp.]